MHLQVHVLLILRVSELDTAPTPVEVSQEWSRGAESIPLSCWPWLLLMQPRMLSAFDESGRAFNPQTYPNLLDRAAFNQFIPLLVLILGVFPTQVQDLAHSFVELQEVCTGSPLKPVQVLQDGIPFSVNCATQLGVVGKLVETALNPTVHGTDKDVTWHQPQY